jgi:hypothetical protein
MSGIWQAFGDFIRVGVADVGETYQRVLLENSPAAPPAGLPGDMVTTHDPVPEAPMNDRQLQRLIDARPEPPAPDMD